MARNEITEEIYKQYLSELRDKEKLIYEIRSHYAYTAKIEVRSYHKQKSSHHMSVSKSSATNSASRKKKILN